MFLGDKKPPWTLVYRISNFGFVFPRQENWISKLILRDTNF